MADPSPDAVPSPDPTGPPGASERNDLDGPVGGPAPSGPGGPPGPDRSDVRQGAERSDPDASDAARGRAARPGGRARARAKAPRSGPGVRPRDPVRRPGRSAGAAGRRGRRHRSKRSATSRWRSFRARWRPSTAQLLTNPPLLLGLALLGGFLVVGVLAPLAYPGDPNQLTEGASVYQNCSVPSAPTLTLAPFSTGPFPLGETAHLGLDVAQGLLLGTRWDLLLLGGIVTASVAIGALVGALAGTRGGWLDHALGGLFDGVLAFPPFLIVALLLALVTAPQALGLRTDLFVVSMVAVLWAPFAQGVRAQARMLARRPFVEASRAAGARWSRVIVRHILPNCSTPVLAQVPATISTVLVVLGSFQYIGLVYGTDGGGLGCPNASAPAGDFLLLPSPTFPEWTWTLANGALGWHPPGFGVDTWWAYVIPAAWIALFLFAVLLVCDGLVAYLSPFNRQ